MENVRGSPNRPPKMSVSRISKSRLNTALTSKSTNAKLDETQMSHAQPTTSYVIKSHRQRPKRAVIIYFAPMKLQPDIARTEMQLCNDADVPLLFKLRSDTLSKITASPAGSGCIPPRAEQRCFLTWRRSTDAQTGEDVTGPKLMLITNFVEQEIDESQTVMTRLIARIHAEGREGAEQNELPLMKFTFERTEEVISPSKILSPTGDNADLQPLKMHSYNREMIKELNRFIQWSQQHPLEARFLRIGSLEITMDGEVVEAGKSKNPNGVDGAATSSGDAVESAEGESDNATTYSGMCLPFEITSSSSSDTSGSNHSKICRFCLSDEDIGGWLSPCKCTGTMKWVHVGCFEHWLSLAPVPLKYCCAICHYVYRRRWKLKPYKLWHWPQLHLRVSDIMEIYIDISLTYRLCRGFPRCLDNRVTFLIYAGSALLWKLFVATKMRLYFYSNIAYNLALSICSSTVLDAL